MSANTAAMKARMLKQIDLMCEVMDEAGQAGQAGGDVEGHYVDGLRGFVWGDGSERGSDGGLDYLESDYRPLISEKEQVTYEAAERSPEFYGAFGTNPGFPGWVSGGGYLGGTNPPPPMNPVPEPASFGLVGVGLIAAWKVRKG